MNARSREKTAQETEGQGKETDREVAMKRADVGRMQSQERHCP